MKRFLVMALVACFVLGASLASAKEMAFQGQFQHAVQWTDNTNFQDGDNVDGDGQSEDDFIATQRVRMYFKYIDSENLSGVVGFEIDSPWGGPRGNRNTGGQLGTDATSVEVKQAYTDFKLNGVSVRVGLQGLGWPSAVAGSPIWNDDVAGIVASYAFNDMVSLTLGWARLWDNATGNDAYEDEIDAFTAILPIKMDGWSLTPYAIYAAVGANASSTAGGSQAGVSSLRTTNATNLNDNCDLWYGGAAFSVTAFDPFVFNADLVYGSFDGSNESRNDREGWFFAASLDYKMDMVTPSLVFMYGTGDDDDPFDGSEAMPNLGGGGGGSCGFGLTTFGFDGGRWTTTDGRLVNAQGRYDMWALGLVLKDFSLVEDLTQTFRIVYGMGTTDSDLVKNYYNQLNNPPLLTDEDSFWEVNLDSSYQIYENLSLWSEIGYISLDRDSDVWGANLSDTEAAMKLAIGISYNF